MAILNTLCEYFHFVSDVQNIIFFCLWLLLSMSCLKNLQGMEGSLKKTLSSTLMNMLMLVLGPSYLRIGSLMKKSTNNGTEEFMEAKNLVSAHRQQILEEIS